MPNSISANQIVQVTPSVLSAGGTALDLNGVVLTSSARVPVGQVLGFPTSDSVGGFFGLASPEYGVAVNYFLGFTISDKKPGNLYFSQYNTTDVSAYLAGGFPSLLTSLQAVTAGTLTISIDGINYTASAINLAGSTSYSSAAAIIQAALDAAKPNETTLTGSIAGTVLTVTAITAGGTLATGLGITGAGVTANTKITGQLTGVTGGVGTYSVSISQTVASIALTAVGADITVAYDATSLAFRVNSGTTGVGSSMGYATGTLAALLSLTLVTGATLSQGALASTPFSAMTNIKSIVSDWATFTTLVEPTQANKIAFAQWNNAQNNRYMYVCWDTDVQAIVQNTTSSTGYLIRQAQYGGVEVVYGGVDIAAFQMGAVASIDFDAIEGRSTMAFKQQTGINPTVFDDLTFNTLKTNGYNLYGQFATANDVFRFLYPGTVSGPFKFVDSYINQIWMSNQFQLALMVLFTNVKSIPFNQDGYTLVRAACQDVINQALTFGAIRTGVVLSEAQKIEVNQAAGVKIDDILSNRGYYMLVRDPGAQVRASRGPLSPKFWYCDGGSVQSINLGSINVQ